MVLNFLWWVWALIPKRLLVGLAACFFAYFLGVSHGREPYKLAAAVSDEIAKYQNKTHKQVVKHAAKLTVESYEKYKNDGCIVGDGVADGLSNYITATD